MYNNGIISKEQALEYATSASDIELKMNGLISGKISGMAEESSIEKNIDIAMDDEDIFDLK